MKAKTVKIGNNLAFMIPQSIAAKCRLEENDSFDFSLRKDEIVIRSINKRYNLSDLLAGITQENLHEEVGRDEPVGKEIL
ncbi:antitoxin MazE [Desulfosarcina sp. BuS5]|uniref:AbrB/MazE/SpoVT family DNA-binding domain-containing protein n=1 Tax=Desulfosarcina sp. BuS5 TaxID=933262 RepID=UPI00048937BA|nr:MazF family transcriptional regulator [Desulfosarcina sp. BuS5]WDN88010.1 antitoxin MazE [Desulfosarcina sp. BuS5]